MSVMVEGNTDLELIMDLDFEFEQPCDQYDECDNPAEWKATTGCCGQVLFFCTPCREEVLTFDENYTGGAKCLRCGKQNINVHWEKL